MISPKIKIALVFVFILANSVSSEMQGADEFKKNEKSIPFVEYPAFNTAKSIVPKEVTSLKHSYGTSAFIILFSVFGVVAWVVTSSKRVKPDELVLVNSMGAISKTTGHQWVWGIWPIRKLKLVEDRPKWQVFGWSLNGASKKKINLQAFVAFRNNNENLMEAREIEKLVYHNLSINLQNSFAFDFQNSKTEPPDASILIEGFKESSERLVSQVNGALKLFGIEVISCNFTAYEYADTEKQTTKSEGRIVSGISQEEAENDLNRKRSIHAQNSGRNSNSNSAKFRKVRYKRRYLI